MHSQAFRLMIFHFMFPSAYTLKTPNLHPWYRYLPSVPEKCSYTCWYWQLNVLQVSESQSVSCCLSVSLYFLYLFFNLQRVGDPVRCPHLPKTPQLLTDHRRIQEVVLSYYILPKCFPKIVLTVYIPISSIYKFLFFWILLNIWNIRLTFFPIWQVWRW